MFLQPENDGFLGGGLITADAFKNAQSIMKGVGQNMDIGLVPGDEFAVQPDFFGFFQDQASTGVISVLR